MSLYIDEGILQRIKNVLRNDEKVKDIIIFGSRAKGNAKPGSDIDVALIGDNIEFDDLCRLGTKLDELDLPYKIDIINYDSIKNPELKDHIDRVGIKIVE